jgi:hypothetical protein
MAYFVLFEFASHGGTSKNTNIAQNRTPSYRFCDGIVFAKTLHEVIWAPENRNMNNPDFFSYWTNGSVVTLLSASDAPEKTFIIFFYVSVISGALMTNQIILFDIP